jgi:molecular chaperone DnaK
MPTTGLSEADIERLVAEAVDMAEDDVARRALADAKVKAEGLLYSAERALGEFGHVLSDDERAVLTADLDECKRAIEEGQLSEVEDAVARLEASAQQIGEAIYAAAAVDPGDPVAGSEPIPDEGEGEVG